MRADVFLLLLVFCSIECRKTYAPIDKNANIDFINMEMGGGVRPEGNARPAAQPAPNNPVRPTPAAGPAVPTPTTKAPVPTTKPVVVPPQTTPVATPVQPVPNQIKPVPVNPAPVSNPITTPGPGSVKHLINFYDSQGKGSPIRPYSYSQAVKQG